MRKLIILAFSILALSGCNKDFQGLHMDGSEYNYTYNEKYTEYGENPFIKVSDEPTSTFAIDADGGAYANMRRYAHLGQKPPVAAVRIEEYINYFNFDYPDPSDENVSINSETSVCPWNSDNFLMRIGLKGKSLNERPPSNFVFLMDVSGSMNSPDKLGILKKGFSTFVDQLTDDDRVAIVTYAGAAAVLLQSTSGSEKRDIKNAIDELGAGGSTAGAQGIITAYEIAEENFITSGNNRIILGSDGDFNVGPSSTDELVELIEEKRDSGIFLTVIGVGGGNLNDGMMEQIANNGNGNYEYIDKAEQLDKVFIHEYDKFFTVAKDAKIQLEFDLESVDSYRLIGYENRVLENEDFENDSTDAGEIGASQCITALYEIIPASNPGTNLASMEFRYKKPDESSSRLLSENISFSPQPFAESSENMRFAVSVAALGLMLKESEYKGKLDYPMILEWAEDAVSYDPFGFKNEFIDIIKKVD
ncbi:MAG: VWA domain-containing protein [Bacteroidetes bacterium]|jgi:Ca-activated chloride channel homolog|nr:VWA domain-containing protein [Bacteroidota bacterium]MBT4399503.1 VWA domain-containing protein [Bacteroidota bacterium]MBT4408550.1 VWA domain-containing protein [Bacteroidota bacterium]MBT5424982.1 VWA domain-containing protein [Bacteroidota bacterium]MBT7466178.1 VWA domain-containing protein [Bacteroidota bacterium]